MSKYILDFEQPLEKIEKRIEELKSTSSNTGVDVSSTLDKLYNDLDSKKKRNIF